MRKFLSYMLAMFTGAALGWWIAEIMRQGNPLDYLADHKATALTFGGLIVTSGIKTMPPPGTPLDPRTWFYDWSHQFFNLPNNRLNPVLPPVPPLTASAAPVALADPPAAIQQKVSAGPPAGWQRPEPTRVPPQVV